MHVIHATDPDDALNKGLLYLGKSGIVEQSRNGRVLVAPGPVTTVYADPTNRVSFCGVRDANPFFHLMEAMWMLAGADDVATVARYASRMREFSDNGRTLNGAYGYRWRKTFGDQLKGILDELRENPTTRRLVLSMWNPEDDPHSVANGSKDVPCNTHAYVWQRDDALHLTVCCRSNDVVWGAYGANVVHFSFLLEYLANRANLKIGTYTQVSNNYHAYIDRPDVARLMAEVNGVPAKKSTAEFFPLRADLEDFDLMVTGVMKRGSWFESGHPFFATVLRPMIVAHDAHRIGHTWAAMQILAGSRVDWHVAGRNWLERRHNKQRSTTEVR